MRRDEDPQDQHIALGSSQQNEVVTRGELDKLVSEMNRKVELSQLALMEKLDALLTLRPPTTPVTPAQNEEANNQEASLASEQNRGDGQRLGRNAGGTAKGNGATPPGLG